MSLPFLENAFDKRPLKPAHTASQTLVSLPTPRICSVFLSILQEHLPTSYVHISSVTFSRPLSFCRRLLQPVRTAYQIQPVRTACRKLPVPMPTLSHHFVSFSKNALPMSATVWPLCESNKMCQLIGSSSFETVINWCISYLHNESASCTVS